MISVDPRIRARLKDAFYRAHIQYAIPGVWLTEEAVTAMVNVFCCEHDQIVWHSFIPEGVHANDDYDGSFQCDAFGWHGEVERKEAGWTAYAIKGDEDWVKVEGSPFTTKEAAASAVELFIRRQHEVRDLDSGVGAGGSGADGVGEPEALTGGTREYLTRGT